VLHCSDSASRLCLLQCGNAAAWAMLPPDSSKTAEYRG
jgi:hypothetical protein